MITELKIPVTVHLGWEEIWVAMFRRWDFSQQNMIDVTGWKVRRTKDLNSKVGHKLGCDDPGSTGYNAEVAGFDRDGTYEGEDIFPDHVKRKILLIKESIVFRFPPK